MKRFALAIAIAATVTGCAKSEERPAELPANPPAVTATQPAAPAASPNAITGKVLETMSSGGYSYIRLETPAGESWVAVNEAEIKAGSTITVTPSMTMTDFESPTLKRKFASLVFGTLGDAAAAAPSAMGSMPAGMGGSDPHAGAMGGDAQPVDISKIKVEKAEGPDARTIEEIWTQKDALTGKRVVVRGVVVKYSANIMGKNWLHIRDGSGSADKKTDDITVTTSSISMKGDTVVVTGKVALNVGIGAGYNYPVLIEDASIAK